MLMPPLKTVVARPVFRALAAPADRSTSSVVKVSVAGGPGSLLVDMLPLTKASAVWRGGARGGAGEGPGGEVEYGAGEVEVLLGGARIESKRPPQMWVSRQVSA